jgi:glycosyltransferase involved in cell wall biosynthesis
MPTECAQDGPLVSVVIPTFNRADLLRRALRSVAAQTYRNLEVLVADDGSTEDIAAVVAQIGDERVRHVRLPHAGSAGGARNGVMPLVRGEYCAFLDSDDEWEPEKIARQTAVLRQKPDVVLAWTNAKLAIGDAPSHRLYFSAPIRLPDDPIPLLLKLNPVIISMSIGKTETLRRAGPFSETLRVMADYDMWMRVLSAGRGYYDPWPGGTYHRYPGNLSDVDLLSDAKERLAVLKNFARWTNNAGHRRPAERYILAETARLLFHAVRGRRWDVARKALFQTDEDALNW